LLLCMLALLFFSCLSRLGLSLTCIEQCHLWLQISEGALIWLCLSVCTNSRTHVFMCVHKHMRKSGRHDVWVWRCRGAAARVSRYHRGYRLRLCHQNGEPVCVFMCVRACVRAVTHTVLVSCVCLC
jgi:hypothetical protein